MFSRLINYIKETRQELYKVNWPTRSQTVQSTLLIIVISLVIAFYLGAFDYLYHLVLGKFILNF